MLPTWIEGLGLTVPQLIGFVLTIVASFFAARFGASESRRQHREKVHLETLTAAGEAIQSLHTFARRLEGIFYDIGNERSSKGHVGQAHSSLADATLPDHIFQLAAKLGENNLADLIALAGARQIATQSISASFEYVDQDDAVTETQAWSAKLILMTFDLMNQISRTGRVPLVFRSSIEKHELEEVASGRIDDLSVRQIPQRYGRSVANRSR